jgi:hypothetical protein
VNHLPGVAMPEEIDKILELAGRPAPQPPAALPISKSARFSRACAFLALGSVIVFWLMIGLVSLVEGISIVEVATKNLSDLTEFFITIFLIAGIYLLPCLSIVVAITAVMGFIGAKRSPGNRKVVAWALVLTALAVAGFFVPLLYIFVRTIRFW